MPTNRTGSRAFADETERKFQLTGCKITRLQLNKVVQTMVRDFPPSAVTMSSTRHGTKIRRATLDDLLSAIGESTLPGDPQKIDNLKLCVHSRTRNASLSLDTLAVHVRLSGTDTDWVLGRTQELADLMAEVRPRRLVAKSTGRPSVAGFAIGGFMVGALVPVLAALAGVLTAPSTFSLRFVLSASSGIVGAALAAVGARWYIRRSSVQLFLDGGREGSRHLSVSDVVAIVTAGAILSATVVGIEVAHHDATRPPVPVGDVSK